MRVCGVMCKQVFKKQVLDWCALNEYSTVKKVNIYAY